MAARLESASAAGRRLAASLFSPFVARLPEGMPPRSPWLAGTLSLIPGLGQLYNGQPRKGAAFAVIWAIVIGGGIVTFRLPISTTLIVLAVLWMIYAFHDGVVTAVRINGQYWHLRLSLAAFLVWIFEVGALLLILQYVGAYFLFQLRYIGDDALAPFFMKGDRVLVDRLTPKLTGYGVGDVVYYRPEEIVLRRMEGPESQAWYVRNRDAFERILAGPGQTFERRGEEMTRDGQRLPEGSGPLVPGEVRWDYRFEVPEGRFLILRSYTTAEAQTSHAIMTVRVPRMYEAYKIEGWEEACLVPRRRIIGRVVLVYHPPERRRWVR